VSRKRSGVYAYRVRKPGLIGRLGIPIVSFRWGYVGETTSFGHRDIQHRESQPWAPLIVACYRWHLPAWKPLLHVAETLVILLLWPAYNIQKNRWNPRRITPHEARMGRSAGGSLRWVLVLVLIGVAWAYGAWLR